MGTLHFRPHTESTSLNWSPKKFARVITSTATTPIPNLVQISPWGLVGKWVKYNTSCFIYLYLFVFENSPTGQTGRWIFTFDGSNNADSRKDVRFRVLSVYCTPFRRSNSPKPHGSKTAKIIKRWYYPPSRRQNVNVMLSNVTFLWLLQFLIIRC